MLEGLLVVAIALFLIWVVRMLLGLNVGKGIKDGSNAFFAHIRGAKKL